MAVAITRDGRPPTSVLLATLKEAGSGLGSLPPTLFTRLARKGLCLSCLAHRPSKKFSCGHQICDACVRRHQLGSCLLCGAANTALLQVKPLNGGVRALSLRGDVADARILGRLLQALRRELRSPLYHHFDLVQATGVGLFFALMLFCKEASIEECLHQIPKVQCVKVGPREFKFGRRLRFGREELHNNLVTIVSQPEGCCAAGAHRLWPDCKLDALLEFRGGACTAEQITCAAEKLMASLFYIHLDESPVFDSGSAIVRLRMQCRLPPGPRLMDLILRLRAQRSKLSCRGDGPATVTELCPDTVWDRVRTGQPFLRPICIRAASPNTVISVKMNGMHPGTLGQRLVSNCPRTLQELMVGWAAPEEPEEDEEPWVGTIMQKIEQLGTGLCKLLVSLVT